MSYILQALKKAEAERNLGRVPGLAAPMQVAALAPSRRGIGWHRWMLPAAVLLLALASLGMAAVAWFRPSSGPAVAPVPVAAQPDVAPAVAAMQATAPTAVPPPPTTAVSNTLLLPPTAPLKPPAALTTTSPKTGPETALQPWPGGAGSPTLTLSGSVYADQPRDRMLIINGQVLREGDSASADLVLLSIGPRAAVWRHRGNNYLWRYP